MKHLPEDIIEALYIIKETCDEHICQECPFSIAGTEKCAIVKYEPCEWKIGALPSPWKALE